MPLLLVENGNEPQRLWKRAARTKSFTARNPAGRGGVLPADSAPQLPDQNGAFLADFSERMPHLATRGRERVTFLCTVRQTWAPLTSGPGVDDDMVGWAWMHRRGTEHRRAGGRARVTPGLKLSVPGARVQLHGEEAERGHCGRLRRLRNSLRV